MGKSDAFARFHPAVNFLYFIGAIGFGVVIQHPAYAAAGCIGAASYYLLLRGRAAWKRIFALLPIYILLSVVNPLFNTSGSRVLFSVFGRPYTLEALCYGMAIAAVFVVMMLWFSCYNEVLTSDKFTSLFGNLIPALSLLLVMVLRMIPNFTRRAGQILHARQSVGKSAGESGRIGEKIMYGMTVLSALTDWALEGSVVTADSMRARGYGTARRTSFQIYRMTAADWTLLVLIVLLAAAVLLAGGTAASYTPVMSVDPLTWGFAAYCLYVLIPTVLHVKEAMVWRISISKI
ncbi:MAG: energy-coupling factor transporter transmembrane component T family protein [Hominenteromicrobium sp.]